MPVRQDTSSDGRRPTTEEGLQADPVLRPHYRRPIVWIAVIVAIMVVIITLIVVASRKPTQPQSPPSTPAASSR